jgi:hypothetical protein
MTHEAFPLFFVAQWLKPRPIYALCHILLFWGLRGGADVLFVINAYSLTQSEVPSKLIGRVITVTRVLT